MLTNAFMIVGVIVLAASLCAWHRNKRTTVSEMPPLWRGLWRWRWVIGLALGIASYFIHYPAEGTTDRYMVYGVPFMSFAFDQKGHDYVGPLTVPALILNFGTWALLPQLFFWVFSGFWSWSGNPEK